LPNTYEPWYWFRAIIMTARYVHFSLMSIKNYSLHSSVIRKIYNVSTYM
jgi:hypothetical protein